MQKIHFINLIQSYYHNVGDWHISPLNYYYDFFKDYNLVVHSLYGGSIDWTEIEKDDVIIFGGGGLIAKNVETNSKLVNRFFDVCDNVVAWGIGVSRTNELTASKIDWDKFLLLNVRDYDNPLHIQYVPCVSAKMPQLSYTSATTREVGVIHHGGVRIPNLSFDSITNRHGLETVIKFIASSDAIVTSSYHAALWSTWMGKKVVCANHEWSAKFDYFQYKPEFISHDNINEESVYDAVSRASVYKKARQEAIEANDQFFLNVKEAIERIIPNKGNTDYQKIYDIKRVAKLYAWNLELHKELKSVKNRIAKIESPNRAGLLRLFRK